MLKPITGSFIEAEHPNRAERTYFHDALCAFSEVRWRAKIREMAAIGIDTLVLLATALRGEAYFPLDGFTAPTHIAACQTVLEILLDEADHTGQQVFLGIGFYGGSDSVENSTNPATVHTALRAMNQLAERYGHHKSFVGWYIADEWCIWKYFDERFITYINTITAEAHRLMPHSRVMLAPFGTHRLQADDHFISQLERIDADIIAYQDEVGVQKMPLATLSSAYEALHRAHKKAGRAKLWADMEVFTFEGDVYKSALLPASWERVKAQMKAISPYVEKIIMYTYPGIMTKPDGIARCGCPEKAEQLYTDYKNWLDSIK